MPRKRLTAQDAFIGVREPPKGEKPEPEPVEQEPHPKEEGPEPEPQPQKPAPPKKRATARGKATPGPEQRLAEALAKAQEVAAEKGSVERLTLYLPPEVSGQLAELWATVRNVTEMKIGKSALAAAALTIVLNDAELRADCAYMALRDKLRS